MAGVPCRLAAAPNVGSLGPLNEPATTRHLVFVYEPRKLPRVPSLEAFGRRPPCARLIWGRHPKPFTRADVITNSIGAPQHARNAVATFSQGFSPAGYPAEIARHQINRQLSARIPPQQVIRAFGAH
jgi:hypothetical protein